jgi:hypothetical protein
MARRQSLAPLRATALKNETTSLGTHSLAKPMGFCAATIVRLKSSLHIISPFITPYYTLSHPILHFLALGACSIMKRLRVNNSL